MTRADWFARNTGGGWRTARTFHQCGHVEHGLLCLRIIGAGTKYFDTNQRDPRSRTQWGTTKLCGACALQEIPS